MYISPLFKYCLEYAGLQNPDKIFILSAKYGLLNLEEEIEPYNETLNKKSDEEIKKWAGLVIEKLRRACDLKNDKFIFLAGENYRKYLIPAILNYETPMKGLGIGKQLGYLKNNIKSVRDCDKLHKWFNGLPRFSFPFDKTKIPLNGIYILFEKGERAHGGRRIVRIGTHTGDNQLRSRLEQHFVKENKDRSIFRKNIGRALLKKDKDDFLEKWELDLTTSEAKQTNQDIDFEKQKEIEKRVTKYIQENFDFVVFEIKDKEKRLEFESKIISTISLCEGCKASEGWLGLHSPKEKIRKSGLWLVNELWKEGFDEEEFKELKEIIIQKAT